MTYEEKKKLIDAAKTLKNHCRKEFVQGEKCNCIFYANDICQLNCKPYHTRLPEIYRWSAEDVAIAKHLIAFGIVTAYRENNGDLYVSGKDITAAYQSEIPVFKELRRGCLIRLEDIIKEAEGNHGQI